jgi:hypothetical protein
MLDCLDAELQGMPVVSKGDSRPLVMQVGLISEAYHCWLIATGI